MKKYKVILFLLTINIMLPTVSFSISAGSYSMPKSLKVKYERHHQLEKISQEKPTIKNNVDTSEFTYNHRFPCLLCTRNTYLR